MLWAIAWAHALRCSDLAAVPGRGAVGRGQAAVVRRPERVEHREAGLVPRTETRLRLGHTRPRVLLQQPVRVLAPAGALADELDLRLALPRHETLERRRRGHDLGAADLRERRPLVAEDAGVAVLVGGDRARDPHVVEEPREDAHRVLGARVLGIRLDAVEAGLGADTGDLELGDERRGLAAEALDVRDGALGREEREARQVLDVALVEDDEPARPVRGDERVQPLPPFAELVWVDAGGDGDGATIVGRTGQAPVCRRRSSSSTADGCNPRVARRT